MKLGRFGFLARGLARGRRVSKKGIIIVFLLAASALVSILGAFFI